MSDKQQVVDNAGRHVFNLEDRIDDAFEANSRFASELTTLRRDAKLSAVVGQDVYAASARMSGHLAAARSEAVIIHNTLEKIRIRHGMATLSIIPPDGDKPPHAALASIELMTALQP